MAKIAEQERKKVGSKPKAGSSSVTTHNRTSGGFFIPFDQKRKHERNSKHAQTTSSFNATSRDAWAKSHASKTNPPEVGKYKPKFSQVEKIAETTVIRNI